MILDAAAPSWAAKRCNEITASFITILGPLVGTIGIQPNIFWYVQWRSTKEPCICRNSWEFASYPGSLPNRFEILSVGSYFSLPVMSKTCWQEKTGDMSYKNKSEYFSVPNGIFLKSSGRFVWDVPAHLHRSARLGFDFWGWPWPGADDSSDPTSGSESNKCK